MYLYLGCLRNCRYSSSSPVSGSSTGAARLYRNSAGKYRLAAVRAVTSAAKSAVAFWRARVRWAIGVSGAAGAGGMLVSCERVRFATGSSAGALGCVGGRRWLNGTLGAGAGFTDGVCALRTLGAGSGDTLGAGAGGRGGGTLLGWSVGGGVGEGGLGSGATGR